ncbi:MAG: single-stranded-DNA-specific exonuclease RecJ [Bacteroidetes bacterium]|nr:single-stranded-DNA-specific exonuclease RecJ [Bacteroidota bacterium]
MSLEKIWIDVASPQAQDMEKLAGAIRSSTTIARLLLQRGIASFDEAKLFFNPGKDGLHPPMLMKNMDKAVEKIRETMNAGGLIRFYGDYDVDGTTSASMMYWHFRRHLNYETVDYYTPDRYKEGYGVSEIGIEHAVDSGVELLITLDCGIKDKAALTLAAMKGLPVIVCDHHRPGSTLPPSLAILNPKQSDCPYPYKELSGCGVGFKLLMALNQELGLGEKGLDEALQFAAVSTCCDIVEMKGENRCITALGLQGLNTNPLPGFKIMKERSGKERDFKVEDVVFILGPRINAAGRISHAHGAIELLTAQENDDRLEEWWQAIQEHNASRRVLDQQITREALQELDSPDLRAKKSTVVFRPTWHKGVVGIVASRLVERYYRPTIVLTESQGVLTGSARTSGNFDVYEALLACSDLLTKFGGHTHAAGLSLLPEQLPAFQSEFERVVENLIKPEDQQPGIKIDAILPPNLINRRFFQVLERMEPCGPANLSPVFRSGMVQAIPESVKILKEEHLKLVLKETDAEGNPLTAIGFGMAELAPLVAGEAWFELAFSLSENSWNGTSSLQLMIKDIKARP